MMAINYGLFLLLHVVNHLMEFQQVLRQFFKLQHKKQ